MGSTTGIEWTDATWNPIIGCSRVSEGCRHCYAEGIAARFASGKPSVYSGLAVIANGHPQWTGRIAETKQLLDPLKWRKSKRVFVNSMSDLFHENVTDEQRDRIFAVMALCPQHTFQVLTKRPERMLAYITELYRSEGRRLQIASRADKIQGGGPHTPRWLSNYCYQPPKGKAPPLPNLWLGVSDEGNQHQRVDQLRAIPAVVRFISAEPLLFDPDKVDLRDIHWVICGGESGLGARPMRSAWAQSLRDQCTAAGVPFFFKQWGEHLGEMQDAGSGPEITMNCSDDPVWIGKKRAGAMLDGREWKQFPAARI